MKKICTTKEQSQKLIELGLDVNTAREIFSKYVDDNRLNMTTNLCRKRFLYVNNI